MHSVDKAICTIIALIALTIIAGMFFGYELRC